MSRAVIQLSRGLVATVSPEDLENLSRFKWHAHQSSPGKFYAARQVHISKDVSPKIVYMHREITGCPPGVCVDHIDGDRLNNQRDNLRAASIRQNAWNSRHKRGASEFKGVYMDVKNQKWTVQIKTGIRVRTMTGFLSAEIAARVYDLAAYDAYGEFACPNFPDEIECLAKRGSR